MNRKKFIESHGATCRNWTWSWSFVNEEERFVIFGAWDKHTSDGRSLILSKEWRVNRKGRKAKGYGQSREHIGLVEEEGYELRTFPMQWSPANEDDADPGPSKIAGFEPVLTARKLARVGGDWFAYDTQPLSVLPEEVAEPSQYYEGASNVVSVNSYERNADARARCIQHHGAACLACGFDFGSTYGPDADGYIHVHHVVPLADVGQEYRVDPIRDLIPLCPNCHAVAHLSKPPLAVEQLRKQIRKS